jgi:hypothetical protein
MATIYLNNTLNDPVNNPPGFNMWVGGEEHGDPDGVKVDKTDTNLPFKITSVPFLQTWYYDYEWYSGANINGPFVDGMVIQIPKLK